MGPVALIGSGLIGSAWAVVFARGGLPVRILDREGRAAANALPRIDRSLAQLADGGLLDEPVRIAILAPGHLELDRLVGQPAGGEQRVHDGLARGEERHVAALAQRGGPAGCEVLSRARQVGHGRTDLR